MATAMKAFTILTREQKAALSRTLDGFVDCLASATSPNPNAKSIVTENAWHNRANWEDDAWEIWETWGWYRHWGRTVSQTSPFREPYTNALSHPLALSFIAPLRHFSLVFSLFAKLHEHNRYCGVRQGTDKSVAGGGTVPENMEHRHGPGGVSACS